MKKTVISMPIANEESTIERLIDEIMALPYDNLFLYLIIDKYSKDNTEKIILSMENKYKRVKLLYNEKSTGVVSCYLYGFKEAIRTGAEWIIEMDAGRSHLPEEINQFIDKLSQGYECVWGSRYLQKGSITQHPMHRKLLSSGGTVLSNLVLGTKYVDFTSGFQAFKKEILDQFNFDEFLSKGHMYQTEMRFYCRNYKTIEVPIHYIGSKSSIRFKSVTEALRILFQLKNNEKRVHKNLNYKMEHRVQY
jgi:glycosyltransferase involved in cell wall biosynthesis